MSKSPIQETPEQITIDKQQVEALSQGFLASFKTWFKEAVNSVRIPSVINFIFKPLKEALDLSPPKEMNWERLGLEKSWKFFVPLITMILLWLVVKFVYLMAGAVLLITAIWLVRSFK